MNKKILLVLLIILSITNVQAKTYTKKECKQYAHNLVVKKYHWKESDYKNLVKLWKRESGWNAKAYNKRSNACGVAQACPCSKMKKYGKDYKTNCKVQIRFGLAYIKKRYKNPTSAWKFWKKKHWY